MNDFYIHKLSTGRVILFNDLTKLIRDDDPFRFSDQEIKMNIALYIEGDMFLPIRYPLTFFEA